MKEFVHHSVEDCSVWFCRHNNHRSCHTALQMKAFLLFLLRSCSLFAEEHTIQGNNNNSMRGLVVYAFYHADRADASLHPTYGSKFDSTQSLYDSYVEADFHRRPKCTACIDHDSPPPYGHRLREACSSN